MDYCALVENGLDRSTEVRAADVVPVAKVPRRIHAVPMVDGKPALPAVCGYRYTAGGTNALHPDMDWMTHAHRTMRCRRCSERLGVADGLGV